MCMASSQSEKKRCEKVREECTNKCLKYLGTGDWKFSNCRNVCIKDAGCDSTAGDKPYPPRK